MTTDNTTMIYVHIPFCDKKCYYCNFVSYTNNTLIDSYFEGLYKEILKRKTDKIVTSIFIGGGTPTSVHHDYIAKTLETIKNNFTLAKNCEITIEANPKSTTKEKLQTYFASGINRISFGVQSLDEKKLEILGREQTNKQVFEALENAKEVGFSNISVDLLLGLENQTIDEVLKHSKTLISYGISHISAYMLILEENTPLAFLVKNGQVKLPSDDQSVEIYERLYRFLKTQGFERYEISNFAKNGLISQHNLGYWQMKEYLGFGVGAHSFVNLKRLANSKNILHYLEGKDIFVEDISQIEYAEEAVMLGLRTKFGVNKKFVKNQKQLSELLREKFVQIKGESIVISEDNFGVTNAIILKLVD